MFPRWLSWLVFGLIGYMLITSDAVRKHENAPLSPTVTPQTTASTTQEKPAADPFIGVREATDIERWKRAINPDYAKQATCALEASKESSDALSLKVIEDVVGTGEPTRCGETIGVHITVWGPRGAPLYNGEMSLTVGAREVALGLDIALVGIRPSGIRTVILPPGTLQRVRPTHAPAALTSALPTEKLAVVTVTRVR